MKDTLVVHVDGLRNNEWQELGMTLFSDRFKFGFKQVFYKSLNEEEPLDVLQAYERGWERLNNAD